MADISESDQEDPRSIRTATIKMRAFDPPLIEVISVNPSTRTKGGMELQNQSSEIGLIQLSVE